MVNETTVPQEPSLAALRKVRVEGQKIDASALLGLVANATTTGVQKCYFLNVSKDVLA